MHKQADERRISDASAMHEGQSNSQRDARCTRDRETEGRAMHQQMDQLKDQRWTSDGPADGPAMDQLKDQRWTSDGPAMHERQSNSQTNDGRAGHGPRLEQTRERRTMDDRETRLLYHRRLERLAEIVVNSNYSVCFTSVIHTEEEELHSFKLHRDGAPIDDGIHAIPHGLDAITTISSISALLLPLQSRHYVQAMEKNATLTNAVHLQLQSLLNSQ